MITEIELENVRLFEGSSWHFSLPPLSVFCGTNNSGKSTILKTLLLLRQSQEIREPRSERQGRLELVGQQVDLGNYSSLVSHNETHRDILIAITIEDQIPFSLYKFLCLINNENLSSNLTDEQFVLYQLKTRFIFGISQETVKTETSMISSAALKKAVYEISVDEKNLLLWEVVVSESRERNEPKYEIIIPRHFLERLDESVDDKEPNQETLHFKTSLKGILPFGLTVLQPLPPIIREATSDLDKALSDIHYLGPLRSPGKRHYVGSPNIETDEPSGKSIPFLLVDVSVYHSKVWNCPPRQPSQAGKEILADALNFWLYYLRTGHEPNDDNTEIEVSVKNDLYVEVKIKSVTETHNYPLIDSGFGYSQVLPILVKGLLAKPGQTLVVEQPELHLNPALQVRLADFLVAMVCTGKQLLIETHSEHIVDAIRVLYAEDETGQLENKCRIFFIDTELDKPSVLQLDIKKDGSVPDWPQHFFGEAASLTGRLLRAQKKFRKKSRTT
ncbi:hypothetical protein THIOM_000417, partial [Candidatus Thiomargarita nelsonii]